MQGAGIAAFIESVKRIGTGKTRKAVHRFRPSKKPRRVSQPELRKGFHHFLPRHVRGRKYFSVCKRGNVPPTRTSRRRSRPKPFQKSALALFEKASVCCVASMSSRDGHFDAYRPRSIFSHAHVAGENDYNPFAAPAAKLCEAFLTVCGVRLMPDAFFIDGGRLLAFETR